MKWIVKNPKGENAYMIKSVKDGLYFELFTWRDGGKEIHASGNRKAGISKPRFATQGRYPTSLEHAFRMIAECIIRDDPTEITYQTAEDIGVISGRVKNLLNSYGIEVI